MKTSILATTSPELGRHARRAIKVRKLILSYKRQGWQPVDPFWTFRLKCSTLLEPRQGQLTHTNEKSSYLCQTKSSLKMNTKTKLYYIKRKKDTNLQNKHIMENLSKKNKNILPTNRNKIETWENIPKVKWEGLPKKEDVNQLINQNQKLIKSKPLLVIEAIQKRTSKHLINNETITQIANVHDLICHPEILRIAYAKVKGNKGALTPGTDPKITADSFAEQQIQELSKKLKTGTFKWKPVRRIMVEKPGKKKKTIRTP
jgi:hypothetical protein